MASSAVEFKETFSPENNKLIGSDWKSAAQNVESLAESDIQNISLYPSGVNLSRS